MGFPRWLKWLGIRRPVQEMQETGSVSASGRSPGKGNGNTLQYAFLGNPMDRGVWQAQVPRVAKSWTQLSD